MALAVSVMCAICVIRFEKLLCMVSRVSCMDLATAMIGGSCAAIWGMTASTFPMSVVSARILSEKASTPSSASNTDRIAEHAGRSKQCCSQ
ncbi:Uncharacterised protein [Mycobacteroides abscessus]|nr:Uncharacterised protein [Mycobacteroides abscessus]